jgi:hypothetical protein
MLKFGNVGENILTLIVLAVFFFLLYNSIKNPHWKYNIKNFFKRSSE